MKLIIYLAPIFVAVNILSSFAFATSQMDEEIMVELQSKLSNVSEEVNIQFTKAANSIANIIERKFDFINEDPNSIK